MNSDVSDNAGPTISAAVRVVVPGKTVTSRTPGVQTIFWLPDMSAVLVVTIEMIIARTTHMNFFIFPRYLPLLTVTRQGYKRIGWTGQPRASGITPHSVVQRCSEN